MANNPTSPIIWVQQAAKLLREKLNIADKISIMTGDSDDPTAIDKEANIGSLYFQDGTKKVYKKEDNGSTTNWLLLPDIEEAIEALGNVTGEPSGFPNRVDSVMSFDNGTRTFSIAPVSSSFDVYEGGTKYTFNSSQDVVIPDTEGIHFFYFEDGTLVTSTTFTIDIILQNGYAALIYWDATNSQAIFLADERHGITMDGVTHAYLHLTRGTQYISGLALGDIVADDTGSLDAHATISVGSGTIADEDITFNIDAITNGASEIPVFYKEGTSGVWRRQSPTGFPVINATTGNNRLAYNHLSGSTWQQTEVSNNSFVLAHIFATTDINFPVIAIQGQSPYGTISSARVGATDEINNLIVNGLPTVEFKPIGTLIYQTSNSYTNTVKARIRTTDTGEDYVDFRSTNVNPIGTSNDHGSLGGLTDVEDHPGYSTIDGTRDYTGLVGYSSHPTIASDTDIVDRKFVQEEATRDMVVYRFTNWNPGNGTQAFPTAGTEVIANSAVASVSFSSGTLTATFARADNYEVKLVMEHNHSNTYSSYVTDVLLGGTCTVQGPVPSGVTSNLVSGDSTNNQNGAQDYTLVCETSAGSQTVTIKPGATASGIGSTTEHAQKFWVYIKKL